MSKNPIFHSVWVRLGLGVLSYEAVLLLLTWLFNRYFILQWVSFGDAMFAMGALATTMAAAGLMRDNPFGNILSPWGVPALPVQSNEDEKRKEILANFLEQQSFGVRLFAAGVLTIVLSIVVSNIK